MVPVSQVNDEIAALLGEYAALLHITGGDAFRARNYEKAARAVAGYSGDLAGLDAAGLRQIPGVGASIAGKIGEYQRTGTIKAVEELRARIPAGVLQLTRIPALGPKRALQLYQELGISSVGELEDAIRAGQLAGLRGFGARSEEKLLRGIELLRSGSGRVLLSVATDTAAAIVAAVSAVPGCLRCTWAGSLRRMRETIGDIDILAAAADSAPLMAAFAGLPEAAEVIVAGPAKTSIRTTAGLQVDLRVVQPDCWGAALQYFTGSKEHNVRIREIAVRKKLRLSEYGLFDVESGALIVSSTEDEIYRRLGMDWIPLRVLRGHRPRAGPVPAADDHREDACPARPGTRPGRPAGRDGARGSAARADGVAARDRAEHRPGWHGGLAGGLPRRLRHLRGLGALAFRPPAPRR